MDLVKLQKTSIAKSIKDLVRTADRSGGPVTLLLDLSSSMNETMGNGRRRIDGLRDAVKQIQAETPTSMAAFGNLDAPGVKRTDPDGGTRAAFVTEIDTLVPRGGTPLAQGLELLAANNVTRTIVISDGEPNDGLEALEAGKKLGRCDCIFVGDAHSGGREFLRTLAEQTGGTMFDGDLGEVKTLVSHVIGLLGDGQ